MKEKDLLKEYNRKRDFSVTREPSGKKRAKKSPKLTFVVQEHHARRLHYDFRLEWEGVLKSWAVPKGPSPDPADKRLAVQTEDHPLEYGKFKGTIPEGEYGAGEVFIWDHGTWEPEGDVEAAFRKGHIEFTLKGKKLSGRWRLIRTHYKGSSDQKSWLLMKSSDEVIKSQIQDRWPGFIAPQLPQLVTEPPEGEKWLHEMKFDGYRMQAHLQNGIALFYTRNGLNWSNSFPHLLEGVGKLKASSLILDGEIVALDEEGRSHFQRLQNSMTTKKDKDLRYYVFDILYQDGEDLRKLPLHERKERLRNLLKNAPSNILFSEHFEEGEEFFKLSCEHQLEGIVSKIADSPYRSGRNKLWSKAKCSFRQEFVIGGYSDPQGGRAGFGALLLGIYEGNQLRFVGKVGTGFTQQSLKDLKKQLSDIHTESSPFDLNSPKGRNVHWVEPIKVAEVSFSQWTNEGILRTPVFLGLREDKPAKDIHVESVTPADKRDKQVTSPDKVLFKKEKITKKEIAQFYQTIAPHMLPYMKDRPLSLVRCPDGSEGTCFYQKHISGKIPEAFTTFPVLEGKGEGIYLSIDSADGLFELVQLNAFELHAWNCQRDDVMHPDQIVMDFDPGPGVAWKEVVSAAFELKALLEELNLKSFVKLTGGKGIHVHVPIAPVYDWDQIKSFSQTLALQLVSMNPKKYVANMAKNQRKGKIFVDYLRNGFGSTAVVPYSLRAKPLSAVALPLEWKELKRVKGPQYYNLKKALLKIKRRKADPWKGMVKLKQRIKILEAVVRRSAA